MSGNSGDFVNPGSKVGLEIWRIEQLHAKPVDPKTYGKFYSGDCYIVLNTFDDKYGKRAMDLFFWLGEKSSQDERGGVAYKAVELDDQLGGKPVQHREVQGHESAEFLSLFPKGVQLLDGGVDSAFRHVDPTAYKPRLFHLKGKRNVRVQQVELSSAAMNEGDVFILDAGLKLYQWNGAEANRYEKFKGLEMINKINDDERGAKAELFFLDSGKSDNEPGFWNVVGSRNAVKKAHEVSSDDDVKEFTVQLIQATGGALTPVASGSLDRASLDSTQVYIVDAGQIFVWVGKSADAAEKKKSTQIGSDYLAANNRPDWTSVTRVVEGSEAPAFKALFKQWEPPRKIDFKAGQKVEKKVAASDSSALFAKRQAAEEKMVGNNGKTTIWRIENFAKAPLEPSLYGQFFAGDSYIVLYTYKSGSKENNIIYFWQGRQSSQDEKGTSALLTKQLFDELGAQAVQVRVVQGKEPNHFISLFKGKMVVHNGGKASAFKNKSEADAAVASSVGLYHVRGTNQFNTHAVQVNAQASELNSGDCFVLTTPGAVYAWNGMGSNDEEKVVAKNVADLIAAGRSVSSVEEGSESDAFWDALGGKTEYQSSKELQSGDFEPRLFQCSNAGAGFKVTEVFNFSQDDLVNDDVMLLDAHSEVFIWLGHDSNKTEKDEALNAAANYVKNAPDGRDADTPIFLISAGGEPPSFTVHFHAWDNSKASDFEDPYLKKLGVQKSGSKAAAAAPVKVTAAAVAAAPAAASAPSSGGATYTLEQLKGKEIAGVDPKHKEIYLHDAEFQTVFGCSKAEFAGQPAWKRDQAKKKAGIF